MAFGKLGLVANPTWSGTPGRPQAVRIIDPGPGQVQLPVDHGMPGAAGIHQADGDLGVLDPPSSAGVLALHPNRGYPLLEIPGLIHHQDRLGVTDVLDQQGAHVVADRILVPHRPGQQVLHPIGAGIAGMLSDRPAVLTRQVRKQPTHERPGPPPQLHPSKPTRNPAHHLVDQLLPPGRFHGYAVACGHRLICCRHNTGSSMVAALVCWPRLTAGGGPSG
jgi:hypothetical protein